MPAEDLELLLRKGSALVEQWHVHANPDDHAEMQGLLRRAIARNGYGEHLGHLFELEVYREVGQRSKYKTYTL